jgi:hypothetical protein
MRAWSLFDQCVGTNVSCYYLISQNMSKVLVYLQIQHKSSPLWYVQTKHEHKFPYAYIIPSSLFVYLPHTRAISEAVRLTHRPDDGRQ